MELAVNTFYKGMELDVHPLVLSQETLRDCLNGTYITENGNDFILLNDMGNRKIPYVKLPKNYIPIGMKEFGGIIYVAAYNPITKYGQIGSFPSPLLYIEENSSKDINIEYNGFEDKEHTEENEELEIRFLKELSKSYILTDNVYIGDSFSISEDLTSKEILPVLNTQVNPNRYMNNKYLLLFGIINSQNNFIDITKDLKSVGKWKPSISNSELDYYVFNTNSEIEETINYFKYKIAGPLALKLQYNIPSKVLYNIYGVRSSGRVVGRRKISDITLYIDCNIEFNSIYKIPNLNASYEELSNSSYTNWFLFKYKDVDKVEDYKHPTITYNPYIYFDELKNLYIANIKGIVTFNTNVHVMHLLPTINYFIGTPSTYNPYNPNNTNTLYVEQLSQTGVLDINYLPIEDSIDILYWQFETNNGVTTLRYLFDAVGDFSYTINLIKADDESANPKTLTYTSTTLNTPVSWIITDNDSNGNHAEVGEAYKATITTIFTSTGKEETIEGYWVLCTPLFNTHYLIENPTLRDFCKPLSNAELNILKELLNISIEITLLVEKDLEEDNDSYNNIEAPTIEGTSFSLSSMSGSNSKKYYILHDIDATLPSQEISPGESSEERCIEVSTNINYSNYPSYLRTKLEQIATTRTISNLGSPNIYYTSIEKINGVDTEVSWTTGTNVLYATDVSNNTQAELESIENNILGFGALILEKFLLVNKRLTGKIKLINKFKFTAGQVNFKQGSKIVLLKSLSNRLNSIFNSERQSISLSTSRRNDSDTSITYEFDQYSSLSYTNPSDTDSLIQSFMSNNQNKVLLQNPDFAGGNVCAIPDPKGWIINGEINTHITTTDIENGTPGPYDYPFVPSSDVQLYFIKCTHKDTLSNETTKWVKAILDLTKFNDIEGYCPTNIYNSGEIPIYGIVNVDSSLNRKIKEYVLSFDDVRNKVPMENDPLGIFLYTLTLKLQIEGFGSFDIYDKLSELPVDSTENYYCFVNTTGDNLTRMNSEYKERILDKLNLTNVLSSLMLFNTATVPQDHIVPVSFYLSENAVTPYKLSSGENIVFYSSRNIPVESEPYDPEDPSLGTIGYHLRSPIDTLSMGNNYLVTDSNIVYESNN